jgi:hypothetical protein
VEPPRVVLSGLDCGASPDRRSLRSPGRVERQSSSAICGGRCDEPPTAARRRRKVPLHPAKVLPCRAAPPSCSAMVSRRPTRRRRQRPLMAWWF